MRNYFGFNLTGKKFFPVWISFLISFAIPYAALIMLSSNIQPGTKPSPFILPILLLLMLVAFVFSYYFTKLAIENISYKEKTIVFSGTFGKYLLKLLLGLFLTMIDPVSNSRLRVLMQNAKNASMPKENVERAIKKATSKDQTDYKEVVYEGYAPYGIAVLVETATDNTTRTVANVRSYFNKCGGSLGTSGCVDYLFEHKCLFKVKNKEGVDIEELEFEMIDRSGRISKRCLLHVPE